MVSSNTPLTELAQVEQAWSVASPDAVGGGNWTYFSAGWIVITLTLIVTFLSVLVLRPRFVPVAPVPGRLCVAIVELPIHINMQIGLIATDWGGTLIEAWSSPGMNQ